MYVPDFLPLSSFVPTKYRPRGKAAWGFPPMSAEPSDP